MPNMYARGILFGKMVLELGDISSVKNEKTDYACEVEFKTKVRHCTCDRLSALQLWLMVCRVGSLVATTHLLVM